MQPHRFYGLYVTSQATTVKTASNFDHGLPFLSKRGNLHDRFSTSRPVILVKTRPVRTISGRNGWGRAERAPDRCVIARRDRRSLRFFTSAGAPKPLVKVQPEATWRGILFALLAKWRRRPPRCLTEGLTDMLEATLNARASDCSFNGYGAIASCGT